MSADKNDSMFVERRRPDNVTVFYYEHDCDWISKYCEEHHRRYAVIPRSSLPSPHVGGDGIAR